MEEGNNGAEFLRTAVRADVGQDKSKSGCEFLSQIRAASLRPFEHFLTDIDSMNLESSLCEQYCMCARAAPELQDVSARQASAFDCSATNAASLA